MMAVFEPLHCFGPIARFVANPPAILLLKHAAQIATNSWVIIR